jgi:uncharacterized protein involved in exopolysaccharide biosynthesis
MTKTFEDKIALALDKVRGLKDERDTLEKRLNELEKTAAAKDQEIEKLKAEKTTARQQLEDFLNELESIRLK